MKEQEKSLSTKERIQKTAIELFQQYGYDNVTILQICEAVGISKRTFYYHYDSKEQLVDGLTDYLSIQSRQLMDLLTAQRTSTGTLWSLMSSYGANTSSYGPNMIRQIYVNIIQGKVEERFPQSAYLYDTVVRLIENGKASGEIPSPASAQELAFALFHAFRGVTMTWAGENGAFDLEQAFRRVFDAILGIDSAGGQ